MTLQAGTLANIQNDIVKVTYGGVDLGFTTDGIDAEFTPEMEDLLVDEFGASPMDIMGNGANFTVTMRLSEYSTSLLVDMMPGAERDVDGPDSRVTYGRSAGYRFRDFAKTLLLHPIKLSASDKSRDILMHLGVVTEGPTWRLVGNEQRVAEVTFRALLDETKPEGEQMFILGDADVTADATPPTIASSNPLDAAAGVAVGTNYVWTFDEALDPNTVNTSNFMLFETDGPAVAGVVTYNQSTFEVTFNPGSDLSAATAHDAIVSTGVKDVSGNALAAADSRQFTTA
jgi:hypothetical protein